MGRTLTSTYTRLQCIVPETVSNPDDTIILEVARCLACAIDPPCQIQENTWTTETSNLPKFSSGHQRHVAQMGPPPVLDA